MADATTTAEQSFGATATRLSPEVLRLQREQDLEAGDVRVSRGGRVTVGVVEPSEGVGTGTGNWVTRDDAERAVEAARMQAEPASDRTMSAPRAAEAPAPADAAGRSETVELSRTRRTIAERVHESLRTMAQMTAVVEVDMTHLMAACAPVRDNVQRRTGVPLTPLSPTAHALRRVLGRHPVLNASIELDEGRSTYHRDVHLGIAVDSEHGLVVPTVRRAQDLTTSMNPPRVGILASPHIEKRPVVIADELGGDTLAIHQMPYPCLAYDHHSVDGADAARFLTDLEHELETADLLGGAA